MADAPSTPRVRAHRQRRRRGVFCVRVPVDKIAIEALVRMGYLPEALQQDGRAVQEAVETYVADAPFMPVGLDGTRTRAEDVCFPNCIRRPERKPQ
jgi:hypothetical protein